MADNDIKQELQAYKELNVFIGRWATEGEIYESPYGRAGSLNGIDTYEWFAGGYFLIHHVDVQMGDNRTQAIEIIGYDKINHTYSMNSFDNNGTQTKMTAKLQGTSWIFTGEFIRFTGSFSDKYNKLTGKWEYLRDEAEWQHWMDISLTKIQ